MTERGQVKARQYTTVQRLIAAQVTAFLIIGPDLIGYYQNHHKTAGIMRNVLIFSYIGTCRNKQNFFFIFNCLLNSPFTDTFLFLFFLIKIRKFMSRINGCNV